MSGCLNISLLVMIGWADATNYGRYIHRFHSISLSGSFYNGRFFTSKFCRSFCGNGVLLVKSFFLTGWFLKYSAMKLAQFLNQQGLCRNNNTWEVEEKLWLPHAHPTLPTHLTLNLPFSNFITQTMIHISLDSIFRTDFKNAHARGWKIHFQELFHFPCSATRPCSLLLHLALLS